MSFHAHTPGGLRLAFADLPPTLQPKAILSVAPRTDRRLSALAATAIYLAAAAGIVLLGRTGPKICRLPGSGSETIYDIRPDPPKISPSLSAPPARPAVATTEPLPEPLPLPFDSNTPPPIMPERLPTIDISKTGTRPATEEEINSGRVATKNPSGAFTHPPSVSDQTTVSIQNLEANPPKVLSAVNPAYPVMARISHTQGSVVLLMTIDERGAPSDVQVFSGHPAFHAEAERAARLWRFEPATQDGRPVSARFRLTITFRLS